MSTKASILITDGSNEYRVYRHMDGYPECVTQLFADARKWMFHESDAADVAGAVITEAKIQAGEYRIPDGPQAGKMFASGAHLTNNIHGDEQFLYEVDVRSGTPCIDYVEVK